MTRQVGITVARMAGTVSALAIILGAAFTIDSRYVSADEFKKQIVSVKGDIRDLHRARLEDEIFKLELIPEVRRTQADKALLERYRNQLRDLDNKR